MALLSSVLVAACSGQQRAGSSSGAATETKRLVPVADASVSAAASRRHRGRSQRLAVDRVPIARAYLRFDLRRLRGRVTHATLRLYAATRSAAGYRVRAVPRRAWRESSLTYANAPAVSRRVAARSGTVYARTWTHVAVTSLIRRAGRVTLAVTTPGRRRLLFASRESARKPVLVIRTATSGGSATPTPLAAPTPAAAPTPLAAPTHVVVTAATATGISLAWRPAADNRGISGYELFLDGRRTATTAGTTHVFNGLSCGTGYAVGLRAYRDANSHSDLTTLTAATLPCAAHDPVITAAGDIAASGGHQSATAALVTQIAPTRALTLGDNAYPNGSASDYASYYDPSWGQFRAKTSPAPGNHDYRTSGASGYFGYFGDRAPGPYYSFDLGSWHLISLNGEIDHSAASAQVTWLEHDLAAHPVDCVLAYWHGPRFSSGSQHGSDTSFDSFWQALYAAHAEVVLNGHEHEYERFAPQSPSGDAHPNGLREFVVGTGGADLYDFGTPLANSQVRDNSTFGVLELTLHSGGYGWRFVPEPGNGFTDSGSANCH